MPDQTAFSGSLRIAGEAPASPFGGMLVPGRFGASGTAAGVFLVPLMVDAVATVTARRGRQAELLRVLSGRVGVAVTDGPTAWVTPRHRLIGIAPGRFLTFGLDAGDDAALDPVACRVSHPGGVAVLRLAGPRVLDVLATGVAVDLHPAAFPPLSVAVTLLDHCPVTLVRVPDVAGQALFELMTGRSHARSVARWVMEAGAIHGVEIGRPETDFSAGAGFFTSPRYRA